MKPWEYGALQVSENKRYFCNGTTPFFWLGDTAWLMFARLNLEESYMYLRNRKEKGYNVIQATLIQQWPQKNLVGEYALCDEEKYLPDVESGYWKQVEAVVDMAEDLGMYMALLPCWGDHVSSGRLNKNNMKPYLDWLVEKFGNRKNIIWLVGGDVRGSDAFEDFCAIGQYLKGSLYRATCSISPFWKKFIFSMV